MRIEELKPSSRVKGRFLVKLEEGTLLRVTEQEVLDFSLYTGKEITIEEAEALEKSGNASALKTKAYNSIARRPLSRHDLEKKILQWEGSPQEAEAICDRFEELNLLNDESYAKLLATHYHRKGYGQRKIQEQFYQHGIGRDLWEEALADLDQEEKEDAILKFLNQKLKGDKPEPKQLKKVTDALARRGFSWSEIREGVLRYDQSMSEIWDAE